MHDDRTRFAAHWRVGRMTAALLALAMRVHAGLPAPPVEQWRWEGDLQSPDLPLTVNTCLTVPFTDRNGDGRMDADDGVDVLLPHVSPNYPFDLKALTVLGGATGLPSRDVIVSPTLRPEMVLSAADMDGDGAPDIVTTDLSSVLVIGNDGTVLRDWPRLERIASSAGLSLADIDQDGLTDIVVGRSAYLGDGRTWLGAGGSGSTLAGGAQMSVAADIDPSSPGLEVIAGNTLYTSSGAILWQAPIPDGYPGVADLDGDGTPEIVVVTLDDLYLLDASGAVVAAHLGLWDMLAYAVAPLLADIDADGLPEIVVATVGAVMAFEWAGTTLEMKWSRPVYVNGSDPRPTAFDFDCDGAAEIVYRDELQWFIFNGPDGAVLHVEDYPSGTANETPVVTNLDDDPWAEIIVPSFGRSIRVYEVPGSATPRSIFNQITYHVTNVTDDGTVPVVEQPSWLANNSSMAQVVTARVPDPCPAACPTPTAFVASAADLADCNLGVQVTWDPATFPSGAGTYTVYRSDATQGLSCADALARTPVARGLTVTSFVDLDTVAAGDYVYVIEAEDGMVAAPGCNPVGPGGGSVSRTCTVATRDVFAGATPAATGAVLRVSKAAGAAVLAWPALRPLEPGEHVHVKRLAARPPGAFVRASAEGLAGTTWSDPIDGTPLVAYDLLVADACENESPAGE